MQNHYVRLISAALLLATVLIVAPAAGAKAQQKRARADLATQRITLSRQYVVVKPSGKMTAPLAVTVSIRNIGHAAAPPSLTLIRLLQGTSTLAEERIPLPRLAPGHASTQIAVFHDAEPQLGLVRGGAKADDDNKVPGPVANDIRVTRDIPVIAQRWTGVMESDVHTPALLGPTEDDHAVTTPSATFQFSRVDGFHHFAYTVGGEVDQTATFGGQGCSGSGEGSASMSRWGGDSALLISHDLTRYEATLRASLGSPFQVTWRCPDIPTPVTSTVRLKDLLTETSAAGGPVPMSPKMRVLSGHGNLGTSITITYTWHLVADVP